MSNLVDLAKDILRHAEALQAQLDKAGAPQPSLEAGGPPQYPDKLDHPGVYVARAQLIDASRDMFQLALGPSDTLRSMLGPERCNISILRVIRRFDIPAVITKHGPTSFAHLSAEIGVNADVLERILRLGFGVNLFREDPEGHVAHTSLSETVPSLGEWIELSTRDDMSKAILHWDDALRVYEEPRPRDRRVLPWNIGNETDRTFFDTFATDPTDSKLFGAAMASVARAHGGLALGSAVKSFDWSKFGEGPVVDVGGGNGYFAVAVAKAHPKLRVIVQDLPVNEAAFDDGLPEELKSRVTYQVQDFFTPQKKQLGAKAFFMKAIMHDWPDQDAAKILGNLIPEVEKGSRIVILDRVLADPGQKATLQESFGRFTDCLMFTLLGAKERSREQWERLFALTDERLKVLDWSHPVHSDFGVIELGFAE